MYLSKLGSAFCQDSLPAPLSGLCLHSPGHPLLGLCLDLPPQKGKLLLLLFLGPSLFCLTFSPHLTPLLIKALAAQLCKGTGINTVIIYTKVDSSRVWGEDKSQQLS